MKLTPISENLTHVSQEFLTQEELSIINKGEQALRVDPFCNGGRMYLINKGGYHFATLQEVTLC